MNRRSFLTTLAQAAAAFTILPSAATYERKWRKAGGLWTVDDQRLFVETFFYGRPIDYWRLVHSLDSNENRWERLIGFDSRDELPPVTRGWAVDTRQDLQTIGEDSITVIVKPRRNVVIIP